MTIWRRIWAVKDILAAILLIVAMLVAIAALSGCMEAKTVRSEQRTVTERWTGKVTVPIPAATAEGAVVYTPTDLPFDVSRSVEESTDGSSRTQTGIDQAAMAQIGGALAGSLKQAFPALGLLGQTFMGPPAAKGGGLDLLQLLEGGGGGALLAAGGAEAIRRAAKASRAREDEAWEAAQQAKLDHARADERARALAEAKA